MKIIKRYPTGEVEATADFGWAFLFEAGMYVEIDFQDYRITEVRTDGGQPVYLCESV